MVIAAVATVKNEADIIERSVRHLLAEGVERIYIAHGLSDDGTGDVLASLPVTVVETNEGYHFQPKWIDHLAECAWADGAGWILPFDADEFWYSEGGRICEVLDDFPVNVRKLHVRAFQHRDWDHREVEYRSMGKVAYRWEPGASIAPGNHDVHLPLGGEVMAGVLDLREWQFRSFEHMARKCKERVADIDPSLPYTSGLHQRVLAEMSPEALRAEWDRKQSVPVVYDPVPSRAKL